MDADNKFLLDHSSAVVKNHSSFILNELYEAIRIKKINSMAGIVWIYLFTTAKSFDEISISGEKIAKAIGKNKITVRSALKALEANKFISITREQDQILNCFLPNKIRLLNSGIHSTA